MLCRPCPPGAASSSPSRRWASSSSPSCSSASPPRRATRRCRPASTRPRPARSPPRSTRPASPTSSQNNGTAIAVVSGQESKARVALAGQGLAAGGSQPGYELLDKQKLGSSTFQQQIAYQRALEGQIAQTIGQIDGISGAQVQLTLPKDDLFADEKQPATAAVLLNADSTALDPAAIRGIASLVSSSVPNLKPSNVTITDASGSMLWPQDGAGSAGGTASKPAAEARYAAAMQSTLGALIARTVGADKAQVQVHADLNVDKATQEQLQYAKKGTPLETTKETESLKGSGSAARRHRRRGRQPPDLRAERGGGRAATPTTSAPPARRPSASTRP